MNRARAAGLLLCVVGAAGAAGGEPAAPDWENPLVFGRNKLPPRCSSWPCPSAASARSATYERADWVRCLSGVWQFHWAPDPSRRSARYDATIPVPSCWEMQGFGVPLYLNYKYPFKTDPPRVMGEPPEDFTTFRERNPVGSYRTAFTVPDAWRGMRLCCTSRERAPRCSSASTAARRATARTRGRRPSST